MYLDDLVVPRPRVSWWRRLWTCPSTTYLAERGAVRCERRRWHRGRNHRNGSTGWGLHLPFKFPLLPGSHDPHFREWAQTCPLGEWVRYDGPRYSCDVLMTERPRA